MIQSEASFQRRVIRDLKSLKNCWYLKVADRAKKGIPDFLICLNGSFVAIEIKKLGGKATILQQHTLDLINDAQGDGLIADPSNWPSILLYLARLASND